MPVVSITVSLTHFLPGRSLSKTRGHHVPTRQLQNCRDLRRRQGQDGRRLYSMVSQIQRGSQSANHCRRSDRARTDGALRGLLRQDQVVGLGSTGSSRAGVVASLTVGGCFDIQQCSSEPSFTSGSSTVSSSSTYGRKDSPIGAIHVVSPVRVSS